MNCDSLGKSLNAIQDPLSRPLKGEHAKRKLVVCWGFYYIKFICLAFFHFHLSDIQKKHQLESVLEMVQSSRWSVKSFLSTFCKGLFHFLVGPNILTINLSYLFDLIFILLSLHTFVWISFPVYPKTPRDRLCNIDQCYVILWPLKYCVCKSLRKWKQINSNVNFNVE